jgi:putative hemolysin
MKNQIVIIGLILGVILLTGCTKQLVGNDRDAHGCIGSAGYSWCEAKQKCLRTWEENCTACGECPMLSQPAPGWCANGTIQAGVKDACGCQGPPTCVLKACTEEAKLCPDGSAVGRTGPNCEFAPCPNGTGMANPASVFCESQGGTLDIRTDPQTEGQVGICVFTYGIECEEWAYFRGECPVPHNCTAAEKAQQACTMEYMPVCGNDAVTYGNKCSACASKNIDSYVPGECPTKTYVTRDPEQCKVIKYLCIKDKEAFTDQFGCGCQPVAAEEPTGGKLKANDCLPEQRNQPCTREYVPVCGWFNLSVECSTPPCKDTYGNKCTACSDPNVAYWTDGTCPETETSSPGSVGLANPASAYCEAQGGTLDIRTDPQAEGQIGICVFPSGIECEEWAYYRGECTV